MTGLQTELRCDEKRKGWRVPVRFPGPFFSALRGFEAVLVGLGDLTFQRARRGGASLQEASRLDPETRDAGIQHERFVSPLQSRL